MLFIGGLIVGISCVLPVAWILGYDIYKRSEVENLRKIVSGDKF